MCLIGDSGTGKSHLLIGLGTAAAEAGSRVRYTLASKLVNGLAEAADDRQLSKTIARYGRVDLLYLDELGYLELDRLGAELLFQVFTEREERSAIAIAFNYPFSAEPSPSPTHSWHMLVTDLNHFLDLSEDTPGPARRLAEHLSNIVRAATAGDSGTAWESALPCRRRPAILRCPRRMIVLWTEALSPIRWQCSICDDEGVISNWEDSAFYLRRPQLTLA